MDRRRSRVPSEGRCVVQLTTSAAGSMSESRSVSATRSTSWSHRPVDRLGDADDGVTAGMSLTAGMPRGDPSRAGGGAAPSRDRRLASVGVAGRRRSVIDVRPAKSSSPIVRSMRHDAVDGRTCADPDVGDVRRPTRSSDAERRSIACRPSTASSLDVDGSDARCRSARRSDHDRRRRPCERLARVRRPGLARSTGADPPATTAYLRPSDRRLRDRRR